MFNGVPGRLAVLALAVLGGPVLAGVDRFSGSLGDSGNTALVASDMGAAQFGDDLATADNVPLHVSHLAVAGSAQVSSTGFAGGGIDPCFTLFSGSDRASATVLASTVLHAVTPGGDLTLDVVRAPGDYTLAIGVFENMSFAENGGGVLADGVTGLGVPAFFGAGSHVMTVTLPDAGSVPEPGGAVRAVTAALAAAGARRRRRSRTPTTPGGR